MFERSKELLNDNFSRYKIYKILESDHILGFSEIEGEDKKCGLYIKNDVSLPLTEREYSSLKVDLDCAKKIKKGLKKDTELGKVKIYCENNLIFTEKIYTIVDT